MECRDIAQGSMVLHLEEAFYWLTQFNIFNATHEILRALSSSDHVVRECWQGAMQIDEHSGEITDKYTITVDTRAAMLIQFFYHFSQIYDNIINVNYYIFASIYESPSQNEIDGLYEAGFLIG
jgi:hypothetical protein